MPTLREAINIARTEPDSQRSQMLMAAIHSGKMDDVATKEGIDLTKFKEATSHINPNLSKPNTNGGEVAGNIAKTLIKGANPANWGKMAEDTVINSAPVIGKGVAAFQEAVPTKVSDEQVAAREAANAAEVDAKAKITQELNKKGIVPPSIMKNSSGSERMPTSEDLEGANNAVESASSPIGSVMNNIGKEAVGGLKQAGEGVAKMGEGFVENAGKIAAIPGELAAGKDILETSAAQPTEGKDKGFQGLQDVAGGITRTAMSPVGGAINSLPDDLPGATGLGKGIKEKIGQLGDLPASAVAGIAYHLAKAARPDLSEQQLQELVVDPVKAATNLGLVASPEVLQKGVEKAGKVAGKAINKVKGVTGDLAQSGLSMASGLNKGTLETALKNPEGLSKGQKIGVDSSRADTLKMLKNPIDKKISDLKSTGTAYAPVRKSTKLIEVPEKYLDSHLEKSGLNVDAKGKISSTSQSSVRTKGEVAKVQEFYDMYNKKQLTPSEFLNMREDLANLAKYESGKTTQLQDFAKGLRNAVNKDLRGQVEGLERLDTQYSQTISELKKIKDLIYDKKGAIKDNAISSINNLLNKGKEGKVSKIQEAIPNFDMEKFIQQIKVTKALEDIELAKGQKVGAYAHNIISGGAALAGNLPVAVGAIISHPSVLIPILKGYAKISGKSAEFVNGITSKIMKGVKPVDAEALFVRDAIKKAKPVTIQKLLPKKTKEEAKI